MYIHELDRIFLPLFKTIELRLGVQLDSEQIKPNTICNNNENGIHEINSRIKKETSIKNQIKKICSVCKKSITNKLCFCDKLDYYNENIESIIKIQRYIKDINNNRFPVDNLINIITKNIIKNNTYHNKLFIKCEKILKMYPPAKNEYKFIYGNLIQMSVIEILDNIFYGCIDLDKLCNYGSEYKVDCRLNITRYLSRNISIKAKKNKSGNVIIINKLNNNKNYELSELITIIVIIELKDIIIIPHKYIPDKYVVNNDSNISYTSSLFTYLYKNDEYKKYIIHLEQNDEYKTFYKDALPQIYQHDIYSECFSKL
jgi:hypothetical protein